MTPDRFWTMAGRTDDDDACWLWTPTAGDPRNSRVSWHGKGMRVARLAWTLVYSAIPAGFCVAHTCTDRYAPGDKTFERCCNPSHLVLGSQADVNHQRHRSGRDAAGDRNGARLHPECIKRGDQHHTRLRPETVPRGDRNGPRLHPECIKRGEQNPSAKLKTHQVRAIRRRRAAGATLRQLSMDYGVAESTVVQIVYRRLWRHVA